MPGIGKDSRFEHRRIVAVFEHFGVVICFEQHDLAVFYVADNSFCRHSDVGCHAASCALAIESVRKRIRRVVRNTERLYVYISDFESAFVVGNVRHILDVHSIANRTCGERMDVHFCV